VFLLCSSQMPIMTGVEVAREVREMGNPVYIVGCTGNALREDQVRAYSVFFLLYLEGRGG
jgi:CheY-like chemotaxis protein